MTVWFTKHRLDVIFILCILIAGSLALFFNIGNLLHGNLLNGNLLPPYPWSDESEIAADAVATLKNGPQLFYPNQLAGGSLAVWVEASWMAVFGKGLLGLRVLNGLINLVSAVLLYLLVEQLPFSFASPTIKRAIGFIAAMLLAVSIWMLGLGRIATPNWSLVSLMTTLTFYLFWLGLNTQRRRYLVAAGVVMGLLFYGYIPGYFVPLVPAIFLGLLWLINRFLQPHSSYSSLRLLPTPYFLPPFAVMLVIAAPILIYFVLNPEATLQRPLQLADTNQLSATGSMVQGISDMLSTFGLYPNWLWQGNFSNLAFDPVVTVLFVVGLFIALWHLRQPAYLFVLIWWNVMMAPALLSKSASMGFVFEVWRRGVGAQPVSFIFPALAIVQLGLLLERLLLRPQKETETEKVNRPIINFLLGVVVVLISAGLSYRLYFVQWANSGVIPTLFAESPVRLVEWMETADENTLFVFPLRPNVSPTTRPELFTVRYLFDGPAETAFPVMDETTVGQTLTGALATQPATVKLMNSNRIEVDPKNYFAYAVGSRGQMVEQEQIADYVATTYRMEPALMLEPSFITSEVLFGDALQLTNRQNPDTAIAGQNLGVALDWRKPGTEAVDFNTSLALYDAQGFEWVKVDQPLLSAEDYLTTRHWSPGTGSTLYYLLPVPPDIPPGQYELRVVAYNAETGVPLSPVGGNGDLSFSLANVDVESGSILADTVKLAIPQPLEVQFPGGLVLAGTAPPGSLQRPGDMFWVNLWWKTNEPPVRNIGLVLALAEVNGDPIPLFEMPQSLVADLPTSAWEVGQVYRANYPVLLPANLESNEYLLALRLFDLDTLKPLAEQLLFPVSVEARQHVFERPPLTNQLNVDFEEAIRLLGVDLSVSAQNVKIKTQWQALQPMTESYKIFVHLTDTSGRIISQLDILPQQGAAPTTGWVPDEIIEDELTLPLPSDLPAGPYRLVLGLYDEKTGRRLMADQQDHVVLFEGARIQ